MLITWNDWVIIAISIFVGNIPCQPCFLKPIIFLFNFILSTISFFAIKGMTFCTQVWLQLTFPHILLPLFTVSLKLVTVPRCSTWQITSFPIWLLGFLTWRTLMTDVVPLGCKIVSVEFCISDPEIFQEITGGGRALAEQVIFK